MKSNLGWRLAFMFDARNDTYGALEEKLKRISSKIRSMSGDAHVRIGVADRHPDLAIIFDAEASTSRSVDGAIEISVDSSRQAELIAISVDVSRLLTDIAAPSSLEVMAGPYYSMVPVRDGNAFLSLAFRRDADISSAQFQDWWLNQHAGIAIPVLGDGLLAYDQVHLDHGTNKNLGQDLGIPIAHYDAYDNLTWADRDAFLYSISNEDDMVRVYADEVGKIDQSSQRSALMRKLE